MRNLQGLIIGFGRPDQQLKKAPFVAFHYKLSEELEACTYGNHLTPFLGVHVEMNEDR